MIKMVERAKIVFFSIIFCPEILFLLSFILFNTTLKPTLNDWVSNITFSDDKIRFLSFIPAIFPALTLKDFKSILQPDHNKKEILLQWPEYWSLKVCYFAGLIYQLIFALMGLSVWLLSSGSLTAYSTSALINSVLGGAVSYWTLLLAKAKVQEKLSHNNEH